MQFHQTRKDKVNCHGKTPCQSKRKTEWFEVDSHLSFLNNLKYRSQPLERELIGNLILPDHQQVHWPVRVLLLRGTRGLRRYHRLDRRTQCHGGASTCAGKNNFRCQRDLEALGHVCLSLFRIMCIFEALHELYEVNKLH